MSTKVFLDRRAAHVTWDATQEPLYLPLSLGGGEGEFCWEAKDLGEYIQSWGVDVLEICGVDYSNLFVYSNDISRDTDGTYYIYYKAGENGHFEATGESNIKECNSVWCSCDQYGEWNNNGYTLFNNIWGADEGSQCIWANSFDSWGVNADFPNTGGVKSYPNVSKNLNMNISELGHCKSSFSVTVPSGGSYCTSYDIWVPSEIMIWMNKTGAVGPIAEDWDDNGDPVASETNLTLGGHTWNVYHGGSNVVSFVKTSNTNSASVDILAILKWIKNKGWINDGPIEELQFGFEITSSAGGMDFNLNSYSLSYGSGSTSIVKPYKNKQEIQLEFYPKNQQNITADLYNISGKCISREAPFKKAGKSVTELSNKDIPEGCYLCVLKSGREIVKMKKIFIVK